ncbi:MAG: hypothetical protein AAGA03_09150, partial [Planctomycetota bacterium]
MIRPPANKRRCRVRPRLERLEKRLPFSAHAGYDTQIRLDSVLDQPFEDAPTSSPQAIPSSVSSSLPDSVVEALAIDLQTQSVAEGEAGEVDIHASRGETTSGLNSQIVSIAELSDSATLQLESTQLADGSQLTVFLQPTGPNSGTLMARRTLTGGGVGPASFPIAPLTPGQSHNLQSVNFAVAALPGEGFVVAWTDTSGIHAIRSSQNDKVDGVATSLSSSTSAQQGDEIKVLTLEDGSWAAAWISSTESLVAYQVFDSAGSPWGPVIGLTTPTQEVFRGLQVIPHAVDDFGVSFVRTETGSANSVRQIHSVNLADTAQLTISLPAGSFYDEAQLAPARSDGWILFQADNGIDSEPRIEVIDSLGTVTSTQLIPVESTTLVRNAVIATLGSEGYVVAFQDGDLDQQLPDTIWRVQRLNRDAQPVGSPIPVHAAGWTEAIPPTLTSHVWELGFPVQQRSGFQFGWVGRDSFGSTPLAFTKTLAVSSTPLDVTIDDPGQITNTSTHQIVLRGLSDLVTPSVGIRQAGTWAIPIDQLTGLQLLSSEPLSVAQIGTDVVEIASGAPIAETSILFGTEASDSLDLPITADVIDGGDGVDTLLLPLSQSDYEPIWVDPGHAFLLTSLSSSQQWLIRDIELLQFATSSSGVDQWIDGPIAGQDIFSRPVTGEVDVQVSVNGTTSHQFGPSQSGAALDVVDRNQLAAIALEDGSRRTFLVRFEGVTGSLRAVSTGPQGFVLPGESELAPLLPFGSGGFAEISIAATPLPDGGYALVWSDGGGVQSQRFDVLDQPVGDSFVLAGLTTNPGLVQLGVSTALDGRVMVVWYDHTSGQLLERAIDYEFQDISAERVIFSLETGDVIEGLRVSQHPVDDAALTFRVLQSGPLSNASVLAMAVSLDDPIELPVNLSVGDFAASLDVDLFEDGSWIVPGIQSDNTGSRNVARWYSAEGVYLDDQEVDPLLAVPSSASAAAVLSDGGFVVAYTSQQGGGELILIRQFNREAEPIGPPWTITDSPSPAPELFSLTVDGDDGVLLHGVGVDATTSQPVTSSRQVRAASVDVPLQIADPLQWLLAESARVTVEGLPESAALSAGERTTPTRWVVPPELVQDLRVLSALPLPPLNLMIDVGLDGATESLGRTSLTVGTDQDDFLPAVVGIERIDAGSGIDTLVIPGVAEAHVATWIDEGVLFSIANPQSQISWDVEDVEFVAFDDQTVSVPTLLSSSGDPPAPPGDPPPSDPPPSDPPPSDPPPSDPPPSDPPPSDPPGTDSPPADTVFVFAPSLVELHVWAGDALLGTEPGQPTEKIPLEFFLIDPLAEVRPSHALVLTGIPQGVGLSHGSPLGPGRWIVPLAGLEQLSIESDVAIPPLNLNVLLVDPAAETFLAEYRLSLGTRLDDVLVADETTNLIDGRLGFDTLEVNGPYHQFVALWTHPPHSFELIDLATDQIWSVEDVEEVAFTDITLASFDVVVDDLEDDDELLPPPWLPPFDGPTGFDPLHEFDDLDDAHSDFPHFGHEGDEPWFFDGDPLDSFEEPSHWEADSPHDGLERQLDLPLEAFHDGGHGW